MPDSRTELLIDGQWIDITEDVRESEPVTVIRGRRDEGSSVDRGRCLLKLNNRHGKYSEDNPNSEYYGQLGRNTRLRRWVRGNEPYLYISGATGARARVASTAALDVTTDLDVRVDLSLDRLPTQSSLYTPQVNEVIGRYNTTGIPGNRMWRLLVSGFGRLSFVWSTNGDDFPERFSTAVIPYFAGQRFAMRATIDVDNGAGGHTVTFYTAPTLAGPWEQLGDQVITAGTTSINQTGDASLELGDINTISLAPGAGRYYGAELRDGIDGTLIANPDFTAQAVGSLGFTDAAGRTWELQGDAEITDFYRRFYGAIPAWPQRWDQSGNDCWVNIEASGILRRLGQGQKALQSTLRRFIPNHPELLAYWPMEDGADTTRAGSALPGQPPLVTKGLTFAANSGLVSSDALPTVSAGASMTAPLPALPASADGWTVEMAYYLDALPTGGRKTMLRVDTTGGGIGGIRATFSEEGLNVTALDADGDVIDNFNTTDPDILALGSSGWSRLILRAFPNGANTEYWALITPIGDTAILGVFLTRPTFTRPTRINTPWPAGLDGMPIGHLTYTGVPTGTVFGGGTGGADDAFRGESAIARIRRIAGEEDLPVISTGITADGNPVGPQRTAAAMDIIRDCEAADMGLLVEQRETLGLQYLARTSLYNRRPSLVLDHALAELGAPLEPTKDDQGVRNEITVRREDGGSSAPARQETGPLSVDAIGLYDEEVPLNLAYDEQTDDAAGWLLHLGTVDKARIPVVILNLANPRMADHVQTVLDRVDQQSLLTIRNSLYGPDDLHLIVEGYTERISKTSWLLELNCSPAFPWEVGVRDDADRGKRDTAGSVLAGAVEDGATALPVTTTLGPPWITAGASLNGNPAFETNTVGWTAFSGTLARSDVQARSGDWSVLLTSGAGSNPRVDSAKVAVTPGVQYRATGWVYAPAPLPTAVGININWYDGAQAYLSTSSNTAVPAVGVWELRDAVHTAPVGAAFASVLMAISGTPGAGLLLYGDDITLRTSAAGDSPSDFPFDVRCGGERMTVTGVVNDDPVTDTFDRTEASSWGSADTGQVWTSTGGSAADFSVSSGAGKHSVGTLNVNRYSVTPSASADFDVQVSASTPVLATGNSQQAYLLGRYLDANNYYGTRVDFTTAAAVTVTIIKVVAGAPSAFSTVATGLTHVADTLYRMRFQGVGTALKAKVWEAAGTEPAAWQTEVTDAALTAAGSVGVRTRFLSGNTNTLPVVVSFDDFASPQVFTVTRSVNGITKAHAGGTSVGVFRPTVRAL